VFLRVSLAVKSLIRGINNFDAPTELRRRLEKLLRGLKELYEEARKRLNDDDQISRKDDARILDLVLAYNTIFGPVLSHRDKEPWYFRDLSFISKPGPSLPVLMLAMDTKERQQILQDPFPNAFLTNWHSLRGAALTRLMTRRAGLLDIVPVNGIGHAR